MVLMWWAYSDQLNKTSELRWLWQRRLHGLSLALAFIALLVLTPYFFGMNLHQLIFAGGIAIAFCIREALDPAQPSVWHHRRVRPVALFAIFVTSILSVWFIASRDLCAVIASLAIYSRHRQGGARLIAQTLSEINPLRQKVRSLNAALCIYSKQQITHINGHDSTSPASNMRQDAAHSA